MNWTQLDDGSYTARRGTWVFTLKENGNGFWSGSVDREPSDGKMRGLPTTQSLAEAIEEAEGWEDRNL